ncbi:MAG: HEAT repeat domain-containing protein [Candidatus Hydrogenedentes bacterium]|nr:HEAT repeat domain-containing protein [Candidatus Hydrogenedentota bacterium]
MLDESHKKRLDWLRTASEHWDGFIREEAVVELADLGGPEALALLLVRVNDWVPQVRAAAAAGLNPFVTVENAALWVEALPALRRLRGCRRANHAPLLERVEALLARPECAAALEQGLLSADSRIRRYCFLIRCSASDTWDESLWAYAFYTSDVVVHRRFEQSLAKSGCLALALLRRLLGHHYAPLRRLALERLVEQYPDQSAEEFEARLFDRSSIVRRAAQRLHASQGHDPAAPYRRVLAQRDARGRPIRYALISLSELGDPGDWDLLVSYFRSTESALRLCALAGLCRLDAERAREFLLEALMDESPPVVRAAHRRLSRHRTRPLLEELELILEIAQDAHSVEAVLWLGRRLPKWDALILLLLMVDSHGGSDAALRKKVRFLLAGWVRHANYSYASPAAGQRERIATLLNRTRGELEPGLVQSIEWCIAE